MKRLMNWYFGMDNAASDKQILARRQKISHEAREVMNQAVDMIATGAVIFCAVAKNIR